MKISIKVLVCIFAVAVAFLSCDFGTNNESNVLNNSSSSFEPKCDGTDMSLYGFGNPCGCVPPAIIPNIIEEQCGNDKYILASFIRCENDVIEAKCENEWYNPKTKFCYESNILDKCGGEIYYPPDQCENNVIHYYYSYNGTITVKEEFIDSPIIR
jgi:hypothetical protein